MLLLHHPAVVCSESVYMDRKIGNSSLSIVGVSQHLIKNRQGPKSEFAHLYMRFFNGYKQNNK
jgi:hypothetical protein